MKDQQNNINNPVVAGYSQRLLPRPVSREITWDKVREKRNSLLSSTDWTSLPDATPKPSQQAWLDFRQKLRDVTKDVNTPQEVVWPKRPTIE